MLSVCWPICNSPVLKNSTDYTSEKSAGAQGARDDWGGGMDPADQAPGTLERWTSAVACEIPLDLVHIVVQQTEK